jgi:NADH dehydrogenase FAD-containing subunit
MRNINRTEVLVLGGGYAGTVAALRLSRKTRGANIRITLINGRDHLVERIRLHQQAAGQMVTGHSYQALFAGTSVRFLQGWITQLQPELQKIVVKTADGERSLHYDYAIYALGSLVEMTQVPGSDRHAHSLSSAETAEALRQAVPDVAARGGRLLVCGGGLTGIEAASELAETYPDLQVTLLTADQFGEQLSQTGQEYLRNAFDRLGISVMDRQRILAVHSDHVETATGHTVPFDICLWAGSFRAPDLAEKAGLPVNDQGQILVDQFLRVQGRPNLYAVGDAASLEEALSMHIRMGCVTAAPMGTYAGNHLSATIRGDRSIKPFRYRYLMRCISLGRNDGLVQLVTADDTPRERILTGRLGATVKELISRSSVWNVQFEQRAAALMARVPVFGRPLSAMRTVTPELK